MQNNSNFVLLTNHETVDPQLIDKYAIDGKKVHTLTGVFIRSLLLVLGWTQLPVCWTLFSIQHCPNSLWYRFNKVL